MMAYTRQPSQSLLDSLYVQLYFDVFSRNPYVPVTYRNLLVDIELILLPLSYKKPPEYSGVKYITRPAIGNQSSVFVEITIPANRKSLYLINPYNEIIRHLV